MRLLIVNSYDEGEMYAEFFRSSGFAVTAVRTAEDGLAAATRERPDAIVLGAVLPDATGATFAEQLKAAAATASIPLIVLTGYIDAPRRARLHASGADLVLLKPCLPAELLQQVQRLLRTGGDAPRAHRMIKCADVRSRLRRAK